MHLRLVYFVDVSIIVSICVEVGALMKPRLTCKIVIITTLRV